MKREELLKSREYWISKIQMELLDMIEQYRKKNNLNKSELAKKLGCSKGYITQILNGDFDHKVSKLVDLALAFDKVPMFEYEDIKKVIAKDAIGIRPKEYKEVSITVNYAIPLSLTSECKKDSERVALSKSSSVIANNQSVVIHDC